MPFHKSLQMSKDDPGVTNPLTWLVSSNGDLVRSFLAEFIGTAILVIFTCGTCTATSQNPDTLVSTALSFGLTVACLVFTLGHVSGCHINPAVTIGLLVNGQINLIRSIVYMIAQLTGGIAGAGLLHVILKDSKSNLCANALKVDPIQGIIVECLICFLLVLTVCNVCQSNPEIAPIIIALAVTTGHLFAIPLTSSSMNTARSFGPAVIANFWDHHWVYWVGPLLGGALGGFFHRYIFINKSIYDQCETSSKANDETPNVTTSI